MQDTSGTIVTVSTIVQAPVDQVWCFFTTPDHIMQWYFATPEWYVPKATNDLRPGGKFSTTMAARDGSVSFDFEGEYQTVEEHRRIDYTMTDGRKVTITFQARGDAIEVVQYFEAEQSNPVEMQRAGWQTILDNFKAYAESR